MPSIDPPIILVRGTVNGIETAAAVAMRAGEELEEAMSRGCSYILYSHPGPATAVTRVSAETLDRFEFEAHEPLMDGRIPGGILREETHTP